MKTAGMILTPVFRSLCIEEEVILSTVREHWRSLFDEPVSSYTEPVSLKKGTLTVEAGSPAWLQELKYHRFEIEQQLKKFGITAIRLKVSRRGNSRSEVRELPQKTAGPDISAISESDQEWINHISDAVSDPEIRLCIRRILAKYILHRAEGIDHH